MGTASHVTVPGSWGPEGVSLADAQSCVQCTNTVETVDTCDHLQFNSSYSVCYCVHLSTLALVMQVSTSLPANAVIQKIDIILVAVGLIFLSLALLTFAVCRRNLKVTNTALINLCINLLLAQLLYLLTQSFLPYIKPHQVVCAMLAGVLQFLFLCSFVWMLTQAVLLFTQVWNLTKIRSKQEGLKKKWLVLVGYVIPLVVVGVSAGVFPDGYGSDICWLKTDRTFLWSFLGPVCFILAVNVILLISMLVIIIYTLKGMKSEILRIKLTERDQQLFISVILKTIIQFFILGCPWVLGFFTEGSKVLQIIFLVLNSQQGTFIFIIHCALNQEFPAVTARPNTSGTIVVQAMVV
ncbi:putative adhesion G protein-coupled receptor E4P [Hoplias malabaricus]|uniref:putative adhesion G protein-coupled receptor E4P n=1 Tax=Hoplias malabaricus TaxID=27720 RepID=UPI003461DAAA